MEAKALTVEEVKKRLIPSFINLVGRQAALQAISWISINIILARVLPVSVIGVFDIAQAIVTFFAFFSDIGLAAALVQKKEALEKDDISTTFTIQLLIVGILSLIIILAAPLFGSFYKLDLPGVWLVRALGLSFFLSNLKVIPSVLMERNLNFKPIVTVDVVETLVFNTLLILFVYQHFGVWSYTFSVLIRGFLGVALIYSLVKVRPGFGVNKEVAKKLMNFGVPYQLNNLLALLKDRLVPLVVARMVGPVGVGYIEWSQGVAFMPLQIMSTIITITFPAFSRMQDEKEELKKAVEKSLFITCLGVYPAVFGLCAILPSVVTYIVTSKWQQALPSFYLFSFSVLWSVISTSLTNVLNATGRIKLTLKLMIFWTVTTWVLTPILVYFYGFLGVAIASFIISFSSALTIYFVKKILEIKVLKSTLLPILASISMGILVYFYCQNFVRDKFSLVLAIVLGVVFYGILIWLFAREKIMEDLKDLRKS